MFTTIIHSASLDEAAQNRLLVATAGELTPCQGYYRLSHEQVLSLEEREQLSHYLQCDINTLPPGFVPSQVRLVISDMDSTLINIECIDEIADFLDLKPQVSAITEQAMRGEIDFETSLTRRVALLKGVDQGALQRVYDERLQLNPGGEQMLAALRAADIRFALVSGGFTYFTERLRERHGLDYTRANTLDIDAGQLTGRVLGAIVGAQAKADFLLELCEQHHIQPSQVVAMGDGANDLKMMQLAGLSLAYHAKPKVRAQASAAFNHGGLNQLLHLLGL